MKKVLHSNELRAGDRIHTDGAVVLLQGEPETYPGYKGLTVYLWREMPIVSGSIHTFPSFRTWDIQGNTSAQWLVERD